MLKPREKDKNPKLISTVEKPTFSALKKKLFTGPFGNIFANKNDRADPTIPPAKIPKTILPNFLFAISLLYT